MSIDVPLIFPAIGQPITEPPVKPIEPVKNLLGNNTFKVGDYFSIHYYSNYYFVYKYLGPSDKKNYAGLLYNARYVAKYEYNNLTKEAHTFTFDVGSGITSLPTNTELFNADVKLEDKIPNYSSNIEILGTALIKESTVCIDDIHQLISTKFKQNLSEGVTTKKLGLIKSNIRTLLRKNGYPYVASDVTIQEGNKFIITLLDKTPPPPPEKPPEEPKINRLNLIKFQ